MWIVGTWAIRPQLISEESRYLNAVVSCVTVALVKPRERVYRQWAEVDTLGMCLLVR